jgi:hypothetical protein
MGQVLNKTTVSTQAFAYSVENVVLFNLLLGEAFAYSVQKLCLFNLVIGRRLSRTVLKDSFFTYYQATNYMTGKKYRFAYFFCGYRARGTGWGNVAALISWLVQVCKFGLENIALLIF